MYDSIVSVWCGVLLLFCGCAPQEQVPYDTSDQPVTGAMEGMKKYEYLVCDGGPHLALPAELSGDWKGAPSISAVTNPSSDYGRAMTATSADPIALITVGSGEAIVLQDPPMTAWGNPTEEGVDLYQLLDWRTMKLDDLIDQAVATTPTLSMSDTGLSVSLTEPDLVLLFAGDRPGDTAYGEYRIPLSSGNYRILEGRFSDPASGTLNIYRLAPTTESSQP
ncbi:MAG: hypothetical protein R3C02_11515 [Planctomycetaceae bacterium]